MLIVAWQGRKDRVPAAYAGSERRENKTVGVDGGV